MSRRHSLQLVLQFSNELFINFQALMSLFLGHHNVSRWDVKKTQELCTVPVSIPHVKGVTYHNDHPVLGGCCLSNEMYLALSRTVNPVTNCVFQKQRSRERPSHCSGVLAAFAARIFIA